MMADLIYTRLGQLHIGKALTRLTEFCGEAIALQRSRIALASLTKEQLEDIGVSRDEAQREAKRMFWDFSS